MTASERDWASERARGVLKQLQAEHVFHLQAPTRLQDTESIVAQALREARKEELERCARVVDSAYVTYRIDKQAATYLVLLDFASSIAAAIRQGEPEEPPCTMCSGSGKVEESPFQDVCLNCGDEKRPVDDVTQYDDRGDARCPACGDIRDVSSYNDVPCPACAGRDEDEGEVGNG